MYAHRQRDAAGGRTLTVADDTATTTETAVQPEASISVTDTGATPDVADVMAKLASAERRIAELNKESAAHRAKAKEAREAAIEAAKKQGDLSPLVSEMTARLSDLAPKAERLERLETALRDRVSGRMDKLPAAWRARVERITDVEQQIDLLDLYDVTVTETAAAKPITPAPVQGSPAAPQNKVDFLSLRGKEFAEAVARDPAGWQATIHAAAGARPITAIDQYQQARAAAGARKK